MPDERNYYVICDDNCKFPAMTKEQILAAITQAIESHEITDVDTGFVTTLKETNKNTGLTFWVGTQAEYNAIEQKVENCFYIVTDDTSGTDLMASVSQLQSQMQGVTTITNRLGEQILNTPYIFGQAVPDLSNLLNFNVLAVTVRIEPIAGGDYDNVYTMIMIREAHSGMVNEAYFDATGVTVDERAEQIYKRAAKLLISYTNTDTFLSLSEVAEKDVKETKSFWLSDGSQLASRTARIESIIGIC